MTTGPGTSSGFYLLHRGWLQHPALGNEPYCRRAAWAWLIEEAAYQERRAEICGKVITLKRGQLTHSSRFMATAWGWSEARVRRFLTRLKTDAMIDAETDAGQYLITICNYEKYQASQNESDAGTDAPSDAEATQERRRLERKKRKKEKPTTGADPSLPLSATQSGGQKESSGNHESAEDQFWALTDQAQAAKITRSLMGKMAKAIGDFDQAYPALVTALGKDNPAAYVSGIIRKREREAATATAGGDLNAPAIVREAQQSGDPVEALPDGRWRIAGTIYDAEGQEVGW